MPDVDSLPAVNSTGAQPFGLLRWAKQKSAIVVLIAALGGAGLMLLTCCLSYTIVPWDSIAPGSTDSASSILRPNRPNAYLGDLKFSILLLAGNESDDRLSSFDPLAPLFKDDAVIVMLVENTSETKMHNILSETSIEEELKRIMEGKSRNWAKTEIKDEYGNDYRRTSLFGGAILIGNGKSLRPKQKLALVINCKSPIKKAKRLNITLPSYFGEKMVSFRLKLKREKRVFSVRRGMFGGEQEMTVYYAADDFEKELEALVK